MFREVGVRNGGGAATTTTTTSTTVGGERRRRQLQEVIGAHPSMHLKKGFHEGDLNEGGGNREQRESSENPSAKVPAGHHNPRRTAHNPPTQRPAGRRRPVLAIMMVGGVANHAPSSLSAVAPILQSKMVKGSQGERIRLYTRGTILGYKRSKSNQYPNTSLIQIEGVNTKEEVDWYLGKRMAYIYKAKTKKNKSHYRCIWGKVCRPHGNSGVVRAKFKSNLPPKSMVHLRIQLTRIRRRPSLLIAAAAAVGARPPGLRHDDRDILVAGNRQCRNHRVHHHVEQVVVPDSGDDVIAEVECSFAEQSEADGDLRVELVDVVGIQVDEEGGVGVLQELEQRSHDDRVHRLLELAGRRRKSLRDDVDEGERGGDGYPVDT
nr:60S ribosomal protein L35a-3 [Ipomoea batatas]GME19044.1 60S ribosomal protein L35a-3 [Ipomoea batatas]